jgi:hypothetical protein
LQREEELAEDQVVRKLSALATADIRATVKSVVESTRHFQERAGYAILLFGARSDFGVTAEPIDMVPAVLEGFCETVLGMTPLRISQEAEAWMLTGGMCGYRAKQRESSAIISDVRTRLQASFGERLVSCIP